MYDFTTGYISPVSELPCQQIDINYVNLATLISQTNTIINALSLRVAKKCTVAAYKRSQAGSMSGYSDGRTFWMVL